MQRPLFPAWIAIEITNRGPEPASLAILPTEYFHGDNGAGLGASHQTGWTALVARMMQVFGSDGEPGTSIPHPDRDRRSEPETT